MKKLFSLLLAIMMVFSLATVAFAEDEQPDLDDDVVAPTTIPTVPVDEDETNNVQDVRNGSITINGVSEENRYAIYKMLHLSGYNTSSGAYSYKIVDDWYAFFTSAEEASHIKIENGYVTWIGADDAETVAAFAKRAMKYAQDNGIDPVQASHDEEGHSTDLMNVTTNPENGIVSGTFANLTMGWYLVDSTMGALCGLTTTNPDASINAKNIAPTIDKQVQEDSTSQYGDTNTADIGQDVLFRTTINVHAGAQNFILHDTMSNGLTFKGVTKVEHLVPGNEPTEESTDMYTVVTEGLDDGCTFHVVFKDTFCEKMAKNDKVIVHYTAMLNRGAVVGDEGNNNTTKLEFGEDHYTTTDSTTTKTFGFDLVKTDSQNTLLNGAQFRVYDALTGGNEIGVVALKGYCADGAKEEDYLKDTAGRYILLDLNNDNQITSDEKITHITEYRRARADEQADKLHSAIVVGGGKVRVVGFDNGTYYLEETVPPDGYNELTARQPFTISDGNLDAIFNNGIFSSGSGVHVVNKTGSMLPETGAMGTTMFIMFGMFVVLGTGVLLVTKKRMSMIED